MRFAIAPTMHGAQVVRVSVDPAGNDRSAYLDENFVADEIARAEVTPAFTRWAPPWRHIQVVTLPF